MISHCENWGRSNGVVPGKIRGRFGDAENGIQPKLTRCRVLRRTAGGDAHGPLGRVRCFQVCGFTTSPRRRDDHRSADGRRDGSRRVTGQPIGIVPSLRGNVQSDFHIRSRYSLVCLKLSKTPTNSRQRRAISRPNTLRCETSRRNRSLKDDEEVLERLGNAGIDRERVLSVDRLRVDKALEVTTLSESDVYNIEESEYVRKAEVDENVTEFRL